MVVLESSEPTPHSEAELNEVNSLQDEQLAMDATSIVVGTFDEVRISCIF